MTILINFISTSNVNLLTFFLCYIFYSNKLSPFLFQSSGARSLPGNLSLFDLETCFEFNEQYLMECFVGKLAEISEDMLWKALFGYLIALTRRLNTWVNNHSPLYPSIKSRAFWHLQFHQRREILFEFIDVLSLSLLHLFVIIVPIDAQTSIKSNLVMFVPAASIDHTR